MQRSSLAVVIGIVGLALGAAAMITGVSGLGLGAGICALGAAGLVALGSSDEPAAVAPSEPQEFVGAPASWAGTGQPRGTGSFTSGANSTNGAVGNAVSGDTHSPAFEPEPPLPAANADAEAAAGVETPQAVDLSGSVDLSSGSGGPSGESSPSMAQPSSDSLSQDEAALNRSTGAQMSMPPELTDPSSGLYNDPYFRVTLEARVASARRHLRPVATILFEVLEGTGPVDQQVAPLVVAAALKETLREADTACRTNDGLYALILEDTPEDGAVWTVERFRKVLAQESNDRRLRAGVACYPVHGVDPTELFDRAHAALVAARDWPQDRIEVAPNLG